MAKLKSLSVCDYTCSDVEQGIIEAIDFVLSRYPEFDFEGSDKDSLVTKIMESVTNNGTDILRSKLEDKFDECDELREELKDLQKTKELVEYQLEQANDEIAKLEKEIKKLEQDVDNAYGH